MNFSCLGPRSLRASYICFSMVVLTASFGVALTLASSVLLLISALIVILNNGDKAKLSFLELAGLGLLGWLILRAGFSRDWEGCLIILNEYRILWIAPIVATAISSSISTRELLIPLIVGAIFYFLGSVLMSQMGDPFDIIEFKQKTQNFYGPYLSLGGKFVNGLLSAGIFSVLLGVVVTTRSLAVVIPAVACAFFVAFYGLAVEEGRSGYIMLSAVFGIFVLISQMHLKQTSLWIVCAATLGVMLYVSDSAVNSQVLISLENIRSLIDGVEAHGTSIGQRIIALKAITLLEPSEILVGLSPSSAQERLLDWVAGGVLVGEPAKSLNLHSDLAHLVLLGGVPAAIGYSIFGWICLRVAISSDRNISHYGFVAGFGVSAFVTIFICGIFNSTMLDIREKHVVLLIYILLLVFLKKADGVHSD